MNDLVKQISSYNLFNYLLPGAVFCVISQESASVPLVQENLFSAFFFYYFIGLVISRIGSIVVEPALRFLKFIQHPEYKEFVQAETKDNKIGLLSEMNNVYRTMGSLGLCLAAYPCLMWIVDFLSIDPYMRYVALGAFLAGVFFLAHRKQTEFVKKRIRIALSPHASS